MQDGIGVLRLEESGTHIEYSLLGIHLLRLHADGVHQVRLSTTRWTIDEHRIELRGVRMLGDRESYGTRQLIALALHIVVERQLRVELCLDVFRLRLLCSGILFRVTKFWTDVTGILLVQRQRRSATRGILHHYHTIGQTNTITEVLMQYLTQQVHEVCLQVLIEEGTRNPHQQSLRSRLVRLEDDGLEPRIIVLLRDILTDERKTIVPKSFRTC